MSEEGEPQKYKLEVNGYALSYFLYFQHHTYLEKQEKAPETSPVTVLLLIQTEKFMKVNSKMGSGTAKASIHM